MTHAEAYKVFWDAYWSSYYMETYGVPYNPYEGIVLLKKEEQDRAIMKYLDQFTQGWPEWWEAL